MEVKRYLDKDLYAILNVERNAPQVDIKRSYRKLALLKHPDKGGDIEAFKELGEAYEVLTTDVKKEEYDRVYDARKRQADALKNIEEIFRDMKATSSQTTKSYYEPPKKERKRRVYKPRTPKADKPKKPRKKAKKSTITNELRAKYEQDKLRGRFGEKMKQEAEKAKAKKRKKKIG
jgi:curved DNA-binding protein CbpA